MTATSLPPLVSPPIFEVACGGAFDPIKDLDPVLLGGLWLRLRESFPIRETRDEIVRPGTGVQLVLGGHAPLRTWFVSHDGAFVLQIQRDRFFLNWRSLGEEGGYPRFSSSPDGVLPRSVALFEALSAYLEETLGLRPTLRAAEVLKIDQLVEGRDWEDYEDLMTLIPALQSFRAIQPFSRPQPAFRVVEQVAAARVEVSLDTLPMPANRRYVRLSTTVQAPIPDGGSYEVTAAEAGRIANTVFESIVPRAQLIRRFGVLPAEAP